MFRIISLSVLSLVLTGCTSKELATAFPDSDTTPKAQPFTAQLSNPAVSVCPEMTLTVTPYNASGQPISSGAVQVGTAAPGESFSRTFTPADLAGVNSVRVEALCTGTGADGLAVDGYSVTEHVVTGTAATQVSITTPQAEQDLTARLAWKTPVPTVHPIDP